jgi:hypothetical protein
MVAAHRTKIKNRKPWKRIRLSLNGLAWSIQVYDLNEISVGMQTFGAWFSK